MDTASTFNKVAWSILSRIVAQSAEKGSWPEVMCAAEYAVESEKLYGPTKKAETVGPVDECPLDGCVLDQEMAAKLWTVFEEKTRPPHRLRTPCPL